MAVSFSLTSTSTTIKVSVTVDSSYPYYIIAYRKTSSSTATYYPGESEGKRATSNFSYTIRNLSPETNYTVNVRYGTSSDGSGGAYVGGQTIDTEEEPGIDVDHWTWTAQNTGGNATAQQTRNAYSAVTNNGTTNQFSYKVWNDMCEKVNEVLDAYSGGSWNNYYASFANTKMTASNKTLTATRWNSLRYNVGSHYATSNVRRIDEVDTGDRVYGWYFTVLMQCVNNWIDRGTLD